MSRPYHARPREMVFDADDRPFAFFRSTCKRGIYHTVKTAVETGFVGNEGLFNRRLLQMYAHSLVDQPRASAAL